MVDRLRKRPEERRFDLNENPWELSHLAGQAEFTGQQERLLAAIKGGEEQDVPGAALEVDPKMIRR